MDHKARNLTTGNDQEWDPVVEHRLVLVMYKLPRLNPDLVRPNRDSGENAKMWNALSQLLCDSFESARKMNLSGRMCMEKYDRLHALHLEEEAKKAADEKLSPPIILQPVKRGRGRPPKKKITVLTPAQELEKESEYTTMWLVKKLHLAKQRSMDELSKPAKKRKLCDASSNKDSSSSSPSISSSVSPDWQAASAIATVPEALREVESTRESNANVSKVDVATKRVGEGFDNDTRLMSTISNAKITPMEMLSHSPGKKALITNCPT